jgi:hypothetical protein
LGLEKYVLFSVIFLNIFGSPVVTHDNSDGEDQDEHLLPDKHLEVLGNIYYDKI